MAPANKKPSTAEADSGRYNPRRRLEDAPSFGSEILKVEVSEDSSMKTFFLHKDIAAKFSEFFAAASRGDWKEARDGVVKLPEDNPEIFQLFEAFTYSGYIYTQQANDEYTKPDGSLHDKEYERIRDAWLLGEKLQASAFKDAVVDAMLAKMKSEQQVPTGYFKDIFNQSVGPSPMKKLLVDIAISYWQSSYISKAAEISDNKDFFVDSAVKQAVIRAEKKVPTPPDEVDSTCIFHEHGDDKPCYKTLFK